MQKNEKTWVIKNGKLASDDGRSCETVSIRIDAGMIVEIGGPAMTVPEGTRVLDAQATLITPGLVNAHTHGHGSLAKGLGDRWTLELLLNAGSWLSANRNDEHKYLAAQVAAAEMIRKGCTAVYDLYVELPSPSVSGMHAVAQAYADMGMRAVVAPMLADHTFFQAIPDLLTAFEEPQRSALASASMTSWTQTRRVVTEMVEAWPVDQSLVAPALAPTIPLHCSDEMLTDSATLARDLGVGLHMHLAESKVQALSGLNRYGKTLTHHLDDIGFLGPDFTAAHAVWLTDDDILRLRDNGASVAHNPGSNLRLGSGIARVGEMVAAGLNVGIGTDGAHCSDNQNMFEAVRLAAFVSRVRSHDYEQWVSAPQALHMGTLGSAKALGLDNVGQVAPGYRADLVFLDLNAVNWIPLNHVTNQLVLTEDATSVDTVMIDGRVVLRDGVFVDFELQALADRAALACEPLKRSSTQMRAAAESLEQALGQFCIGLCRTPYAVDVMAQGGSHG